MRVVVFAAIAVCALSAGAQSPALSGFSAERLARIDRVLQQYVDQDRVAGAVALVLRDGQPVYERAVGWSDKEAGRRMTADTIFRIASQTKAITSVADPGARRGREDRARRSGQPFIPTFAKTNGGGRRTTTASPSCPPGGRSRFAIC